MIIVNKMESMGERLDVVFLPYSQCQFLDKGNENLPHVHYSGLGVEKINFPHHSVVVLPSFLHGRLKEVVPETPLLPALLHGLKHNKAQQHVTFSWEVVVVVTLPLAQSIVCPRFFYDTGDRNKNSTSCP